LRPHPTAEEIAPTLRANPGMDANEKLLANIPAYSALILGRLEVPQALDPKP